jgi:uncharacterized membrane protein YbhN (UPF0104 family)
MAEVILSSIFALIFAVAILATNTVNENPFKLSLRGRRVAFIFAIVAGFLLSKPVFHIQWDCDLRPNATSTECKVTWK